MNRIKLINLNVDNLSIRNYNDLLVSKEFYDDIPTEVFLPELQEMQVATKVQKIVSVIAYKKAEFPT